MMRLCKLTIPILMALCSLALQKPAADPVYDPLWLYQGGWEVSPADLAAGAKPDKLVNDCGLVGKYFACQQTVNGKISALVVFIPAEKPGHYFTQAILPEGWAAGRGELEITGERWTYLSKEQEDSKTTYHRNVNTFSGRDHIHFEISESPGGEHWKATRSGDEVRSR